MNKVVLIGNLTKDIETAYTRSGKQVAQFSIGIRRDKDTSDFPCEDCLFGKNGKCFNSNAHVEWLLEEYKEPILDDIEKTYLLNIIKPFKKNVHGICKKETYDGMYYIQICYRYNYNAPISLPPFKKNKKMYKNMKVKRIYSLEDLDL